MALSQVSRRGVKPEKTVTNQGGWTFLVRSEKQTIRSITDIGDYKSAHRRRRGEERKKERTTPKKKDEKLAGL